MTKALQAFEGEIEQVPPPYSAVKRGGEAAYVRARRGEEVELEPRRVTIRRIDLVAFEPPFLRSRSTAARARTCARSRTTSACSAARAGTLGELVRTRCGPFRLDAAIPLEELDELGAQRVIPMAAATGLPTFPIDARIAGASQRRPARASRGARRAPEGIVQLVREGRMVALLEAHKGIPELRTLRVFLEDESRFREIERR